MNFDDFNLHESIAEGISSMGYEKPTQIQEQVIPYVLQGADVIACAQTGTGKTAAYLLPLIHRLIGESSDSVKALIISPTRELALQIDQQLLGLSYYSSVSSIAIYGGGDGSDWEIQKRALTGGVEIVVATPGKLLSHLRMGYVKITQLKYLILDEADRMLDMGFYEDIVDILSYLPENRQNLMFAATMPSAIRKLAKTMMKDPVEINIALSKPPEGVLQVAYLVYDQQKIELIRYLIEGKTLPSILIFSSTKEKVKAIARRLKVSGFSCDEIHSDLSQDQREKVLLGFRNRQIQILVATDVLSRGIDVEDINLVINYDVPRDAEDYVHRVGRTARAETTGVAITFINEQDQQKFQRIEKLIGSEIRKMKLPERIGIGPPYDVGQERKDSDFRSSFRHSPSGDRKKGFLKHQNRRNKGR